MYTNGIKATFTGRVTRDPERKQAKKTGNTYCEVGVAVNRRGPKKADGTRDEKVTYVTLIMFGEDAEAQIENLKKGYLVMVDAVVEENRSYINAKGEPVSVLEMIDGDIGVINNRFQRASATKVERAGGNYAPRNNGGGNGANGGYASGGQYASGPGEDYGDFGVAVDPADEPF